MDLNSSFSVVRDCDTGLMWFADAAATDSAGLTYDEALEYVDLINNNTTDNIPFNDWRLPGGTPPDEVTCLYTGGMFHQNCFETEFGNLFFEVLGGCNGVKLNNTCPPGAIGYGTQIPNDNKNLALFDNLPIPENIGELVTSEYSYWTEMQEDDTHAWRFSFAGGRFISVAIDSTGPGQAWLVRDVTDSGCASTPTP
jgi:hypothetical protein